MARTKQVAVVTIARGTIIYIDGRAVREGETVTIDTAWAAQLVEHGDAAPKAGH